MSQAIRVSQEEYEAAGGDPMKMPTIMSQVNNIPSMIEADEAEEINGQNMADCDEMLDEPLLDTIAGIPILRSFSAAVFNILMKVKSPIIGEGDKEEYTDAEMFSHYGFVLFILSYPNVRDLVKWMSNGTILEEYHVWSFNLQLNLLEADAIRIHDMIDGVNAAGAEISNDSDGETNTGK